MTTHFATRLTSYLERTGTRALQLEKLAGLPNATVTKLCAGQRPSLERLAEILQVIPAPEAATLLEAYMRDAVPDSWRDAVQIIISVAESALSSAPALVKDNLTRTLEAITARAHADIDFASWLTDTAALLQLIPTDPTDPTGTFTARLTPEQYRADLAADIARAQNPTLNES